MSDADDYRERALEGIRALRYLAARGDAAAADGLLAAGLEAAGHIRALASRPLGHPVKIIMDELAARYDRWPVTIPAIQELRSRSIHSVPASLGSSLPYRVTKGATKPRNFDDGPPSLALDAFKDLEEIRRKATDADRDSLKSIWHFLPPNQREHWRLMAVLLPPLNDSAKCIKQWKEAAIRWAEDQCQGQWKSFPWGDEIINRSNQKTNSRKRGIETAVKEYLGKGLLSVALPLIKGE